MSAAPPRSERRPRRRRPRKLRGYVLRRKNSSGSKRLVEPRRKKHRVSISSGVLRRKPIRRRRMLRVRRRKRSPSCGKGQGRSRSCSSGSITAAAASGQAGARCRRGPVEGGTGQRETASGAIAAVQYDPRDSRHGPGADREYVGRVVRYREVTLGPLLGRNWLACRASFCLIEACGLKWRGTRTASAAMLTTSVSRSSAPNPSATIC